MKQNPHRIFEPKGREIYYIKIIVPSENRRFPIVQVSDMKFMYHELVLHQPEVCMSGKKHSKTFVVYIAYTRLP
jgi:hypothetical protein